MCYVKPGPRCTAHARIDLAKASAAWEANPSEKTRKALDEAQKLYDSTPGGQKELLAQLETSPDSDAIELRLAAGKLLRIEQMRQMIETHQGFLASNRVRRGLNTPGDEASVEIKQDLMDQAKEWRENLDDEEKHALEWYTMSGHETVSILLAKDTADSEHIAWMMRKAGIRESEMEDENSRLVQVARNAVANLDSAFAKAPLPDEPRMLYRSLRVPGAQGSDDPKAVRDAYVKKFVPGQTVNMSAYTSASIDSDLMVYNVTSGRRSPDQHVVFEIMSPRGAPPTYKEYEGSFQAHEHEVLLPRGSKMRVANVLENVPFERTRVPEGNSNGHWEHTMATQGPKRMRVTVIQLVDVTDEQ